MKTYLIADSGGTTTEWCFIDEAGRKTFFTTESYHPVNFNAAFQERNLKFWQSRNQMLNASLFFFGAGCFRSDGRAKTEGLLNSIGFKHIQVESDLAAAGIAALGKRKGWVAILGTGSVLFYWNNLSVQKLIGGKGYEQGDEGSGYYFGKLVYKAWKEGKLTDEQLAVFRQNVDLEKLKGKMENGFVKSKLSDFAKLFSKKNAFKSFNSINFERFIETHFKDQNIKVLSVVGGYAAHHETELKNSLLAHHIQLEQIIGRPILQLVEQKDVYID